MFTAPAFFWSLGANASETIFDAGLRKATIAQYTATYNADVAAYKETVLTAFQQVEDYIATLRVNSQQIAQQDAAVKAAQKYLNIATDRYKTGLDPYLDVISAQTTLLSDQQTAGHPARQPDDGSRPAHPGARRWLERNPAPHAIAGHAKSYGSKFRGKTPPASRPALPRAFDHLMPVKTKP